MRPFLPTQSAQYISKLKMNLNTGNLTSRISEEDIKKKFEDMKSRQEENFAYEMQKTEMKQVNLLGKMSEKQRLAQVIVNAGLKKQSEKIAENCVKQAQKHVNGLLSRFKENDVNDILNSYVSDLEIRYMEKGIKISRK